MTYLPENDGIDHINVYSKGNTPLGRFLSNFARSEISLPEGIFQSVEGYWYWLGTTHPDRDKLKKLYSWQAKSMGRELGALDWQSDPEFKAKILHALEIKAKNMPTNLKEQLRLNKLPLAHYYVYGGKVVNVKDGQWILDGWNEIQKSLDFCPKVCYSN